MKQTLKLLALGLLSAGVFTLIQAVPTQAVSITVATGTDETTTNSSCSLSEAIENINDQAATNTDCVAGDGSNDTIVIPSGTITLIADLPEITESLTITGESMGQSVVDGDGQWRAFRNNPTTVTSIKIEKLTITGFADSAIGSRQGNIQIDQVEIDGNSTSFPSGLSSFASIIGIGNQSTSDITVDITNVHIHSVTTDTATFVPLIITSGDDGANISQGITANLNNITINDITSTGNLFPILTGGGMNTTTQGLGTVNARLSNITITDITSSGGVVAGIATAIFGGTTTSTQSTIQNATITDLNGQASPFLNGQGTAAIALISGGFANGINSTINTTVSNLLLQTDGPSCVSFDVSASTAGTDATHTHTLTSLGGNLSDDTSCSPYFTQATDQNNLTTLGTTLEALSDNGGFVPTIALKQGSPAIDSGITVAGLTNDARLAVRPQGSAYDSGAYESPFTKPVAVLASTGSSATKLLIASLSLVAVCVGYSLTRFRRNWS